MRSIAELRPAAPGEEDGPHGLPPGGLAQRLARLEATLAEGEFRPHAPPWAAAGFARPQQHALAPFQIPLSARALELQRGEQALDAEAEDRAARRRREAAEAARLRQLRQVVAAEEHALTREHGVALEAERAPVPLAEAVLRREVLAGATVLATLAASLSSQWPAGAHVADGRTRAGGAGALALLGGLAVAWCAHGYGVAQVRAERRERAEALSRRLAELRRELAGMASGDQ